MTNVLIWGIGGRMGRTLLECLNKNSNANAIGGVDKFANNKETVLTTNVYSIVGKEAIVVKTFDSSSKIGQIKVGSEKWTARSANDEIYSEGDTVRIDSIDGVKAIVSKL